MRTSIIKYLTLAIALGIGALNPRPAAAQLGMPCSTNNLLINPSFEDGTFLDNGDGCQTLLLNATTMTGWTVISDQIARCQTPNIVNIPASHGSMFLDLSGYDNNLPHGGVQQTVTTVPGQIYTLAFDLGVVQGVPDLAGPITVQATVTGWPAQQFTHNPPGTGVQWAKYGFTFTASSASTTVTLEGISTTAYYIGLDNVSLCAEGGVSPVITMQPQSLTVTQNQSAGFSVATTGTAPFSYQWRRGGAAVAGATNDYLILSDVPLAEDGKLFRVVVSNDFGSVTSDPAILHVVPDVIPPTVDSVVASCESNRVVVTFNERVSGAEETFNYHISGGVGITGAALKADGRTVCLFTEPVAPSVTYTLTVERVQDLAGNAITPGSSTSFACSPPCNNTCDFLNGDFGQGAGSWTPVGLTDPSGWQPSGGNPGGCFLLNNIGALNTDPTISQQLCCLTPGQCYTIHGQRKVHQSFGQTAPSFAVLVSGVPILTLPVPPHTNWDSFSVSFTATHACQIIGFAAEINGTDVSYYVDNLRIECCATPCTPTQVLHLFSGTGTGGALPGGAQDPQFTTGAPLPHPYVASLPIAHPWKPNDSVSKWIIPAPGFFGMGEIYFYTNRFFHCSTNQAAITGRWLGDDAGEILLNGVPTGNVLPNGFAWVNWTPVSINSGFVPGWNELVFRIINGVPGSITGLRTELTGSACCKDCIYGLTCPDPIVKNIRCADGDNVSWTMPQGVGSYCGNIVSVTCNPPSGSYFPAGTTVVHCTAIDSSGNAATCSFTVTVSSIIPVDTTPPVVSCAGITPQTNVGCVGFVPNYLTGFQATDNSTPPHPLVITQVPTPGTAVGPGVTTVTLKACDACGNCASCTTTYTLTAPPKGIPGIFPTGVDDNNVSLLPGQLDLHFSGVGFNPVVTGPPPGPFVLTSPGQWIGSTSPGANGAILKYRFQFWLPCTDAVSISGNWITYGSGTVSLNGGTPQPPNVGSPNLSSFNFTAGFVPGLNTLEFQVSTLNGVNSLNVVQLNWQSRCCACGVTPPAGLVLWLPFDEPKIKYSFAHNIAGGNHGIYQGPPTVNPGYGFVDRSLCFNGTNQYVNVPYYSAIDFTTGDFSIDAWVKRDAGDTGIRRIVDHRATVSSVVRGYGLYLTHGVLTFQMRDGNGGSIVQAGQLVPADGQWHFVAVTVQRLVSSEVPVSPVGRLFMDNSAPVVFNPTPAAGSLANGSGVFIGANNPALGEPPEFFKGCLDEVEICNRALAPVEVSMLRLAGQQGKCKQSVSLPSVGFCPGQQSVTATATICNNSAYPETYTYGLRPCNGISVGLTFSGQPATTVTVPPWTCTTVTSTVPRPPAFPGCIQLLAQANSGCKTIRSSEATLYDKFFTPGNCPPNPLDDDSGTLLLTAMPSTNRGHFNLGPILLTNPYATNYSLHYRIRVLGPDGEEDTNTVSLYELPPGTLIARIADLAPGASTTVEITGRFIADSPNENYTVWVDSHIQDVPDWYPASPYRLREVFQSVMTIGDQSEADVQQFGVSWSSFGTLQCAPTLGGSWTDLPNAANPYVIPAGGGNAQFYRLKQ